LLRIWLFLRFALSHFLPEPGDSEGPEHNFYFQEGGIVIESDDYHPQGYEVAKKQLQREFGDKYAVKYYLVDDYNSDSPEIWQKWWTNQIVDGDDGPWNSQPKPSVPSHMSLLYPCPHYGPVYL